MSLTPYDWNQSLQTRLEYVEERLRDGSPVVAISHADGIYLLSVHRTRRKIFEVYDRLVFSGIGAQSDLETMRTSAIDFCHREGFTRSPDDVTAFRLVGSVLSPALKRAYGDPFTVPLVFRGLFAELGEKPEADVFYTLSFDGEFRNEDHFSVVGGSLEAENRMLEALHAGIGDVSDREGVLQLALEAWGTGRLHARTAPRPGPGALGRSNRDSDPEETPAEQPSLETVVQEELAEGTLEVAFLDRLTRRESKFRLLVPSELEAIRARSARRPEQG